MHLVRGNVEHNVDFRYETDSYQSMPNRHVQAFLTWQHGRGMSQSTIRRRRISLNSYARFCAPAPMLCTDMQMIEEWLATFSSPRTRHAYRSDLSTYCAWAVKRKLCESNPV